jgi:NADH:ubiquinone oxidoreductase subunit 6 (subunit J)
MLTVRFFISNQIEAVRRDNKFDIVMTNIYDYNDNLINEISAYNVSNVNPVLIYQNALVDINADTRFLVKMFVSIDDSDFNKYYGYDIEVDEIYLNHDLPYVLLPKSYEIVYSLSRGDTIKMDLAPDLRDFSFVIGGFINTDFDQFAYTNLVEKLDEYSLKYNAIMINSDNSEATISALIEDYGSQMYYLIDGQAELEKQLDRASSVLELFTVITIFIVLSFMFVVFNNTLLKFYSLKNDYSKIKVLGISDRQNRLNLLFEFLILCTVLVLVGIIEVLILSKYLRYTLLFFDYYKELSANTFVTVISYLLIFISLLISYVYYYIKIKNLSLSEEIRIA